MTGRAHTGLTKTMRSVRCGSPTDRCERPSFRRPRCRAALVALAATGVLALAPAAGATGSSGPVSQRDSYTRSEIDTVLQGILTRENESGLCEKSDRLDYYDLRGGTSFFSGIGLMKWVNPMKFARTAALYQFKNLHISDRLFLMYDFQEIAGQFKSWLLGQACAIPKERRVQIMDSDRFGSARTLSRFKRRCDKYERTMTKSANGKVLAEIEDSSFAPLLRDLLFFLPSNKDFSRLGKADIRSYEKDYEIILDFVPDDFIKRRFVTPLLKDYRRFDEVPKMVGTDNTHDGLSRKEVLGMRAWYALNAYEHMFEKPYQIFIICRPAKKDAEKAEAKTAAQDKKDQDKNSRQDKKSGRNTEFLSRFRVRKDPDTLTLPVKHKLVSPAAFSLTRDIEGKKTTVDLTAAVGFRLFERSAYRVGSMVYTGFQLKNTDQKETPESDMGGGSGGMNEMAGMKPSSDINVLTPGILFDGVSTWRLPFFGDRRIVTLFSNWTLRVEANLNFETKSEIGRVLLVRDLTAAARRNVADKQNAAWVMCDGERRIFTLGFACDVKILAQLDYVFDRGEDDTSIPEALANDLAFGLGGQVGFALSLHTVTLGASFRYLANLAGGLDDQSRFETHLNIPIVDGDRYTWQIAYIVGENPATFQKEEKFTFGIAMKF